MSLAPLEVDFSTGEVERKTQKKFDIAHHIDQTVDAFNRASFNNNVVFVHCAMGVSRSASCVLMYAMKKFRVPFESVITYFYFNSLSQALEFVRERRNVVDPNEGFVKQLLEFEQSGMHFHTSGYLFRQPQMPAESFNLGESTDINDE